jgi:protein-disulfide isomerase
MRMHRTLVAVLPLVLAACASKPDPRIGETAHEVLLLQQQLAEQQRQLDDLKRVVEAAPELQALIDRIDQLAARVDKLAAAAPAARPARREPDRAAVYSVPLGASPVLGSPSAKVTVVVAGEFACPYCRKAWDTIDELRKRYGADLRVVYKSFVVHPKATAAANAACAANKQHKWRKLAELLWTGAFDVQIDNPHAFDAANIDALAAKAGLDMGQYKADLSGPCPAEVRAEQDLLQQLGVAATPSFFINGRFMAGAQAIDKFSALIDEELAKAKTAIAGGVKADRYYEQEIVGKGRTELGLGPNPF